ncbi:MAG: KH domain-containing protein [Chloroflexi bacterium]|nr:KH domain-containing protein [Chloroflexota bacterium]MDA1297357.1 KH domain-containing protein [Chloroflexota bacterium]
MPETSDRDEFEQQQAPFAGPGGDSDEDFGDADSGKSAVTHLQVPEISGSDDHSPLKDMVEYVARALTSNPDAVKVTEEDDGNRTVFRLSVDEKDKGKVIGRDGRVAQSIRALLRVAATKAGTRITLEID